MRQTNKATQEPSLQVIGAEGGSDTLLCWTRRCRLDAKASAPGDPLHQFMIQDCISARNREGRCTCKILRLTEEEEKY